MDRRTILLTGAAAFSSLAFAGTAQSEGEHERGDLMSGLSRVADGMKVHNQPESGLFALDQALAATIGHRLFTVLFVNWGRSENQRIYTNQPQAYPLGGSKPIVRRGAFYDEVIVAGRPRICRNYHEMKAAFPDHELIRSLGCESAVNVPLRWNGKTIGSLNLLHRADWYAGADLPALSLFATMALAPVLSIVATD